VKIFYLLFSGIAGLSLFLSPAFASFQPGEMTLTPQVGYYLTNGYRDLDSALLTGIGLDFRISQPLSVEAFVGKTLANADTLYQARLEGIYHFGFKKAGPPIRFIPYTALGFGINAIDYDAPHSAANLLVAAGGGMKYLLSDNWMLLRLDGRLIASGGKVASMMTLGLCFPFGANQFEQPLGYIEKKEPVVVVAKSKTKNKAKVGAAVLTVTPGADRVVAVSIPAKAANLDPVSTERMAKVPAALTTDVSTRAERRPAAVAAFPDPEGLRYTDAVNSLAGRVGSRRQGVGLTARQSLLAGTATADGRAKKVTTARTTPGAAIVFFALDGTTIVSEEMTAISDAVAVLTKENRPYKLRVDGYTDSRGSKSYNDELGFSRALSVAQEIVTTHGIDPDKVFVKSSGKNDPIITNRTAEGRSLNRRVEIVLLVEKRE